MSINLMHLASDADTSYLHNFNRFKIQIDGAYYGKVRVSTGIKGFLLTIRYYSDKLNYEKKIIYSLHNIPSIEILKQYNRK